MRIAVVRHGESEFNQRGIIAGHIDVELTDVGRKQAEKIAKEIDPGFSAIYSSDLKRCLETSEIINRKLKLPIYFDARLRERNFGALGGKTWDDLEKLGKKKEDDDDQVYDYRDFGGESAEEVKERLWEFLKEIKAKGENNVLVVSHGGIVRLLHRMMHNELRHIPNSSVHVFEV